MVDFFGVYFFLLLVRLVAVSDAAGVPRGFTITAPPNALPTALHDRSNNVTADAYSCWSEWNAYHSISSSANLGFYTTYTTVISSEIYFYTVKNTDVPFTTLCDGWPRALEPITTQYLSSYTPIDPTTTVVRAGTPHTEIQPTCTVMNDSPQCQFLWNDWLATSASWRTTSTIGLQPDPAVIVPPCSTHQACPTRGSHTKCIIQAGLGYDVKLFYWPVTTTRGNFCRQNGITIHPTPTACDGSPNTMVYDGMTFTSPSAYFLVSSADASISVPTSIIEYQTWFQCGPHSKTSILFSVPPQAISSVTYTGFLSMGDWSPVRRFSMNWADLNTAPWSAYSNVCRDDPCTTINDDYTPRLAPPAAMQTADPEWGGCYPWGIWTPTLVRLEPTATPTGSGGGNCHNEPASAGSTQTVPVQTDTAV